MVYVKGQNGREGLRIPENYGGNAFRRAESPPPRDELSPREDVFRGLPYGVEAMPPVPREEDVFPEPVDEEREESAESAESAEPVEAENSPEPAVEAAVSRSLWPFREVGGEDLLLIGLLLILLREGAADDKVWILGLLLFW